MNDDDIFFVVRATSANFTTVFALVVCLCASIVSAEVAGFAACMLTIAGAIIFTIMTLATALVTDAPSNGKSLLRELGLPTSSKSFITSLTLVVCILCAPVTFAWHVRTMSHRAVQRFFETRSTPTDA